MANPGNRGLGFPEQRTQEGTKPSSQGGTSQGAGSHQGSGSHEQAGGIVATIKDKASELASNVASTAGQAWEGAKHTAQNVASSVASTAEDAWEGTTGFMRRYPIATFCIGLGVGFLLAELLMPRRA